MAFKCVPLNPAWTGDTKLDLHAIYARANGDLATLPMRRHHQHQAKGFTYVTLADAESFGLAINFIRSRGENPQDYVMGIDGDGRPTCWILERYLADQREGQKDADAELVAMIAEHGVDVVEKIRGVKVPAHLRPAVTSKKGKPESVIA